MTAKNKEAVRILIPPEFEYLPGLFLSDPARAQWVAEIWNLASRMRKEGYDVSLDAGTDALTAAETAAKLETDRIGLVMLTGLPCDAKAIEILSDALEEKNLEFASPVIRESDDDSATAALEKQIRDSSEPASSSIDEDKVFINRNTPFLVSDTVGVGGPKTPCFIRSGNILRKNGTGPAGSLPPDLEEIRIIDGAHTMPSSIDGSNRRTLYAFALADVIEDPEAAYKCCSSLIDRVGSEGFRLLPLSEYVSCGGAEWGARLGLHHDAMKNFLQRLTVNCSPSWNNYLNVVNLYYALGEDPLEEMYASNSLPDRNAELIENIVP